LQPWRVKRYCVPERDRARFVAQMEEVLDVYAAPVREDCPVVCMDESSKQLLGDVTAPLAMEAADPQTQRPGKPKREDHHYDRQGVRSIFMFFAPHLGWRRVAADQQRRRVDWAQQVRRLVDEDFPKARRITLVCDNLNTHTKASLYQAFKAEEAHRLASKLNIVYTPRNGSWLNVAEIELSILSKQCLHRRIPRADDLDRQLAAWNKSRNAQADKVKWQFTTADARIKLRRLYPTVLDG
jgi:transposase